MNQILKWKCPDCGKEIVSLWEKQLESHKKEHQRTHEKPSLSKDD